MPSPRKNRVSAPPSTPAWHRMGPGEVFQILGSDPERGLEEEEAAGRLARHGPNQLADKPGRGLQALFFRQFASLMVVVLLVACLVSLLLGEIADAVSILIIVLLNAALGVREEYKAEKAIAALRRMTVPLAKVKRGEEVREVSSRDLVRGDVVLLEAGDLVPADCRLFACEGLRVQEASLTGESEAAEKACQVVEDGEEIPLGDRFNMAYMGTAVVHGRGAGVITATGMDTELGSIAGMIQSQDEESTPLQRRLDRLAKNLALGALFLVMLVVLLGLWRGEEIQLLFVTAVSLAVAAIPEGMPAVVTIALALGAERMLREKALIRRLPAVESLGSVTVICTDKTGTLTENVMTVTILDAAGYRLDLTQKIMKTGMRSAPADRLLDLANRPVMTLLLTGGALCNDASIRTLPDGTFSIVGDPTEGALVVAAARAGLGKRDLDRLLPRREETPFDAERRLMTTVHAVPPDLSGMPPSLTRCLRDLSPPGTAGVLFTKGAMDSLLPECDRVLLREGALPLDRGGRERILEKHDDLAVRGMRVLGIACRPVPSAGSVSPGRNSGPGLVYVGMVGILDPPRPRVFEAVRVCREAGIRPVMITGDHPLTAAHIARELAIGDNRPVLTGREIEGLSDRELEGAVARTDVYARVSPAHKLRIVRALKERGHIVAMTGDGVNDAPALKSADVGVAMGITGTEVAKEASDIVLQDDNFATIVRAVREGRIIFDNIRKFIRFILASNSAEILVMLAGPLMGMPLPLFPLQILWINLLSDGLPAVALAVEPGEPGVMERPPLDPRTGIFSRRMVFQILWVGALLGVLSLGMGYTLWSAEDPAWRTVVFSALTFGQMANVLAVRTGSTSLFRAGVLSNRPLVGAVILTCALQLAVIYLPFLQPVFRTVPLTAAQLLMVLAVSSLVFWAVEVEKWVLGFSGLGDRKASDPAVGRLRGGS